MKKLGKLISKNFGDIKENFMTYKGSYIWTFIVTLVIVICYENDYISNKTDDQLWEKVMYFYIASGVIVWLSEVIFKKLWHRITGYIASIIPGVFIGINTLRIDSNFMLQVFMGYIVIVLCIGVFIHIKKQKIKFEKYLLDLFQNLFNFNILFTIVAIGLHLIVVVFASLVLEYDYNGYIFERLWTILIGFLYIPGMIYSITKKKSHITVFVKNLVMYVLYPLTIAALVIMYIYIAKILVLVEMPSNEVYTIVAYIFVLGYTSVLMVKNYVNENKFYKVSPFWVSLTFLPIIVIQIISLSIRCKDYGITCARYLGIILIILEVTVIVLSLIKKKELLEYSLIVLVILTAITTISPINMEDITFKSQGKRMKIVWEKGSKYKDFDNIELDIIKDIYSYMYNLDEKKARKYMPSYVTKEDIKQLEESVKIPEITLDKEYKQIEYSGKKDSIDVKKYSKVRYISGQYDIEYQKDIEKNKKDKELYEDILREMNNICKLSQKELDNNNKIKLSDKKDMVILKLYGSFNEEDINLEDFEYAFLILEK